jgi:hypothetical protein
LSKTSNTLRSTRIHPGADRAYLPPWSSTRPCCAAFGASCSREAYQECDLKELCLGGPNGRAENPVRLPPGRQLQMHYHEEVLQNARAEQRTADQKKALRDKLRPRAKVERKISEVLSLHGLRRDLRRLGRRPNLRRHWRGQPYRHCQRHLGGSLLRGDWRGYLPAEERPGRRGHGELRPRH